VVVPEKHQVELLDLAVDDQGRVDLEFVDAFVESLVLGSATSISDRSLEIVLRLDEEHYSDEVRDRLVRLACVPEHPLNAHWLHRYLMQLGLPERDASWSLWLVGPAEDDGETAVRRLIAWTWPREARVGEPFPTRPLSWPGEFADVENDAALGVQPVELVGVVNEPGLGGPGDRAAWCADGGARPPHVIGCH
jgi:hypothetical protein